MVNINTALSGKDFLFDDIQTLELFLFFIGIIIFFSIIKKLYYRFWSKKRFYIFPKLNVNGITNVAMIIAIAIAIIILLTTITAGLAGILFRAYPGWRSTIEGILIKIGGLLFGPIIGIFIGAATDILSVALTAGMFHYGYFIAAMLFGALSGFIRVFINNSKKNIVKLWFYCIAFTLCCTILTDFFIFYQPLTEFNITILNLNIVLQKSWIIAIVTSVFFLFFLITILLLSINQHDYIHMLLLNAKFFILYRLTYISFKKKMMNSYDKNLVSNQHFNWIKNNKQKQIKLLGEINVYKAMISEKKETYLSAFIPVISLCISVEMIVEIIIMPIYDFKLGGNLTYPYWLAMRTLMYTIAIPVNIMIIYPIYKIVAPSMKYDYTVNSSESLKVKLKYE